MNKKILVYKTTQCDFNEESPLFLNYDDEASQGGQTTLTKLIRDGYTIAHIVPYSNKTLIVVARE